MKGNFSPQKRKITKFIFFMFLRLRTKVRFRGKFLFIILLEGIHELFCKEFYYELKFGLMQHIKYIV
jgi:hypothetical protein